MKIRLIVTIAAVACLMISGCGQEMAKEGAKMNVTKAEFGKMPDGKVADLYTLTNGTMTVKVTNYGGIITSIVTPDRTGKTADVALGFDEFSGYLGSHPFFGAIAGRYANRIAKGKFTLNGKEYTLAVNNGVNHLHGGKVGFDKKLWKAESVKGKDSVGVKLTYVSPDMEEGYPGTLTSIVTYELTAKNELKMSYEATTDKDTVLNLTNHSYFNLAGVGSGDVLGHQMTFYADSFTPVDDGLIPTGEIKAVKGTPWDFLTAHTIGERIAQVPGGYDHNHVLRNQSGNLALAVKVVEPKTGRVMEVYTTQPGVQFYTGNFLDGTVKGKGVTYQKHAGFCLETQHYPDSPNKPQFPTAVLKPGQVYKQTTVYAFSAQ
jgi:aldose 1-epimerase